MLFHETRKISLRVPENGKCAEKHIVPSFTVLRGRQSKRGNQTEAAVRAKRLQCDRGRRTHNIPSSPIPTS
jgi:hypothetical protein